VYCGASERLSLDHRTPEIRGGTHEIENLATACLSCNGAKRDMTEQEYRASVTLLKRPQITEQISEQKKDAASAALLVSRETAPTDEADLYRRSKTVLGDNCGGMVKKLIAVKGNSIPLARAAIEQAATKGDAREYIGAIIRGRGDSPEDLRARGEAW
jgi:hypothetical protein